MIKKLKFVDKSQRTYSSLEEDLRTNILTNRYSDEVAIPPEVELASQYGICRATVRKALETLVKEGLLRKIQGRGTFIVPENERLNSTISKKTKQVVLLSFETSLSKETFYDEGTYLPIITGLNRVLQPEHYNLLVTTVSADFEPPPCLLRDDVDGIIIHGEPTIEFYERYIKKFPHIGIQHITPQLSYPYVKANTQRVLHFMVERFHELGHSNIGFVTSCIDKYKEKESYYAFLLAMDFMKLKVHTDFLIVWQRPKVNGVIPNEYEIPDLTERIEKAFASEEKPTAFICPDAFYATALIQALEKIGFRVPEDVSIMCRYNESPRGKAYRISGYSAELSEICAEAARIILGKINGQMSFQGTVLTNHKFIQGETLTRKRS